MMGIVEHINALEPEFAKMTDDELRAKTSRVQRYSCKTTNLEKF